MLLQNITLNNQYPYRRCGATATNTDTGYMISQHGTGGPRQFQRFMAFNKRSGFPTGYNPGIYMPLLQSEISSYREADFNIAGTAAGLRGYPIVASSSVAIVTTADILPTDDTPQAPTAASSFSISIADALGQLISSGVGSSLIDIYTNTPVMTALLSGVGSTAFSFSTNYPQLEGEASIVGSTGFTFSTSAGMLPTDDSVRNNEASASFSFSGSVTPYATGALGGTAFLAGGVIDEFEVLGRMEYDNAVHVDVVNGAPGTTHPTGTLANPVNNIVDAISIAERLNLSEIELLSDLTILSGEDISGYTVTSKTWKALTLESGALSLNTEFIKLSLYGELSGEWNVLVDCWVYTISNFIGWMRGGSFETITLAPYINPNPISFGSTYFDDIVPMYANTPAILNISEGVKITFTGCTEIVHVNDMGATNVAVFSLAGGEVIIDASCLGGEVHVNGVGVFENNSLLVVDHAGLINDDSAWGAIAADNNEPGTMGNKLNTASSGGVDLNSLADAVWSAAEANQLTSSSDFMAKVVTNKRGLVKEANVWTLVVYDNDGTTPILIKELKDKAGSAISDISAGVMAIEEASSV